MKNIIIISLVVALVFFSLGCVVGSSKLNPFGQLIKGNNTFQTGWDAAKERLDQSPFGTVDSSGIEIKSVSGLIQKIEGNKLTVKISPTEPLADPNLDIRIITVDSNAKISLLAILDDQVESQKMAQDFQNKLREARGEAVPSSQVASLKPADEKDIKLTDLKIGQQIFATASEDIKDEKEFTAILIEAQAVIAPVTSESSAQ